MVMVVGTGFDQYLADGFYMEEFAKYYSNIGTMMLICEGLERLGLGDKYGYGYVSGAAPLSAISCSCRHASLFPRRFCQAGRSYLGSANGRYAIEVTLHGISVMRLEWLPAARIETQGWAKGNTFYSSAHERAVSKCWRHCVKWARRWSEGFDYFIAQMRKPGETMAHPTLFFGLDPMIRSRSATSSKKVSRQRGLRS